jgi:hypothetical protein
MTEPLTDYRITLEDGSEVDMLDYDFRNFVAALWGELGLPPPTAIQNDVAHFLAHGPSRRVVEAFRGVGKSWLTAAYVLWRLRKNPEERVLVVSASKDRADAFSIFCRTLIERVPFLQHLKPRVDDGQRDSAIAFDVGPSSPHQAPSVRSVGITGQMTGGRATIIVADDVETPKNSLTQLQRDRLGELVKEFDAVLVPGGEVVYLGTPQCEESLYNALPERGYTVRVWPARYPTPEWLAHYGHTCSPMIREAVEMHPAIAGRSTEPSRFSDEDLREREQSYGRSGFALQFMLDTRASDALKHPLRISDLIVMAIDPRAELVPVRVQWASGLEQAHESLPSVGFKGDRWHKPMYVSKDFVSPSRRVMWIDPSGRGKDETAFAVVAFNAGQLYLLKSGGYRDGYGDTTLEGLADVAKEYKVNEVWVESNFGDGMFLKLLAPTLFRKHPCRLEEEHSTGQKELRIIDTLEPVLNQHRLIVAEQVARDDLLVEDVDSQLFRQLTRITKDRGALRRDDRLEALASAVKKLVDLMAIDQEKIETKHKEAAVEAALRRFREDAGAWRGGRVHPPKGKTNRIGHRKWSM